uniref:Uncharacterized protein n=1 Tax=Pipistrellus kuhlii TaxID=59472 RepID=A0A7J7WDC1_PIPKU|nr:hypothetical protein mPipKuh1_008046 [Pipistrellus kuhlii]
MPPAGLGSRLVVLWWVSLQTCWDKVPKDEASWDTCGFTLRRSLHLPPPPQLIFKPLPTVTLYLAHEKAGDLGFASFQKYVWLIRTYFFFFLTSKYFKDVLNFCKEKKKKNPPTRDYSSEEEHLYYLNKTLGVYFRLAIDKLWCINVL